MEVLIGRIYKHFKGDYYLVENIAIDSETGEKVVIYRQLYSDGKLYVRPLKMFLEKVNKNGQEYRFELQEINSVEKDKNIKDRKWKNLVTRLNIYANNLALD